ncbi:MAG: hypothetical protein HQL76_03010 [Magnetococcales bacterium]|nr:hypothetical protein [Magnetococcales bacterium]
MDTIAATLARRCDDDGHRFQTADGEFLDALCGASAVRVEEGFGKKRFVFADGSAITMGDGSWHVGFASCFCIRAMGHFPGCANPETTHPAEESPARQVDPPSSRPCLPVCPQEERPTSEPESESPRLEETDPLPAGSIPLPAPPPYTIRTYGKINSTVAIEGSHNKARRAARAMLSIEAGISHAWLIDVNGRIIDAYELVSVTDGSSRIRKIAPGDLGKLNQYVLPL